MHRDTNLSRGVFFSYCCCSRAPERAHLALALNADTLQTENRPRIVKLFGERPFERVCRLLEFLAFVLRFIFCALSFRRSLFLSLLDADWADLRDWSRTETIRIEERKNMNFNEWMKDIFNLNFRIRSLENEKSLRKRNLCSYNCWKRLYGVYVNSAGNATKYVCSGR